MFMSNFVFRFVIRLDIPSSKYCSQTHLSDSTMDGISKYRLPLARLVWPTERLSKRMSRTVYNCVYKDIN